MLKKIEELFWKYSPKIFGILLVLIMQLGGACVALWLITCLIGLLGGM